VVGRNKPDQLDRLIEDVARGRRPLSSVRDDRLREAIRIALRIHRQSPDVPDEYAKLRMRARVLGNLRPRGPSLADHAWTALELLARPAPVIARSISIAALLVAVGMGATVASADTLPDDLLYPVKIASEGVRLALAGAPEDRAEVELSIAEHRLGEAEKLAASGRTSDALVAAAVYSQHLAWAAAELAPRTDTSDLPRQLERRFEAQRDRAQTLATALATNAKSAPAARILAMIATPTMAPGGTSVQRVADTAAGVAQQLVFAAEEAEADATGSSTVVFTPAPSAAAPSSAPARATAPVVAPQRTAEIEQTRAPSSSPVRAADTSTSAPTPALRNTATPTNATTTTRARQRDDHERSGPNDATPGDTARNDAAPDARDGGTRASRPSEPDGRASEALKVVRKALQEARAAADKAKHHR